MSEDTPEDQQDQKKTKPTMKGAFSPAGSDGGDLPTLFEPEEMDIYVNKITLEAFIFHAKPVAQDIERLEYDPADYSVMVIKKDGQRLDLGVKIQWLVRPYFTKAQEVGIVQTKDGETVDGFFVPLIHKVEID